jgi:hypothetical protein
MPLPDVRIYSVPPDWLTYYELVAYLLWVDGHKPRTYTGETVEPDSFVTYCIP